MCEAQGFHKKMIRNLTKNILISKDFKACTTPYQKALGLMFHTKVSSPLIFFFHKESIYPLHMLFVFCTIDVLFLNKERKVVEIKENFRPFTYYQPKAKAKYIIELQKGTIQASKTTLKDRITF